MSKIKLALGAAFVVHYFTNNYIFAIALARTNSEKERYRAALDASNPLAGVLTEIEIRLEKERYEKSNVIEKLAYIGRNATPAL